LPPPWLAAHDLDELRQATEEFTLVIRDMSELQERIKLLQEEIAAQLGEQTNRSLFTLTIVTVLPLPINIVAGLLGMNVGGIPLAENPEGFLWIVAIIVTFTALAAGGHSGAGTEKVAPAAANMTPAGRFALLAFVSSQTSQGKS